MNKTIIGVISFIGGAVVGYITGRKALEKKFDKIVDEEIASVKEAFRNYAQGGDIPAKGDARAEEDKQDRQDKAQAGKQDEGVRRPVNRDYKTYYYKKEGAKQAPSKIRVIKPAEYGATDYDMVSLRRYPDGTITNSDDKVATNEWVETTLTSQALSHMGEYEPDVVYIRNDKTRTDYEVNAVEEGYYDEG